MSDSQRYDVLSPEDLDSLKRELSSLNKQIEQAKRKLVLETKVRDATQSMSRLGGLDRPGSKGRGNEAPGRNGEEAQQSIRKCEELGLEVWRLEFQQQQLERKLLEHTAGVLQMTHKGYLKKDGPSEEDKREANGYLGDHYSNDFSDLSHYRPYSQMTDLGEGSDEKFAQQNQMILDVERRVEDLNARLREMILELEPDKKSLPQPPRELRDDPSNPNDILFEQVDFLERCLEAMDRLHRSQGARGGGFPGEEFEEQSQIILGVERRVEDLNVQLRGMILDMKPKKEDLPNPARELRDDPQNPGGILLEQVDFLEQCLEAMQRLRANKRGSISDESTEEKLEILNTQLYQTMTESSPEKASGYQPPPEATGETLQDQLEYLEGGLGAVNRRLKTLGELEESSATKLASYQERAEQYVSVVGGLWDLLTAPDPRAGDSTPLPPDDDFSLTTFSAKVQEVHTKYVALQEQKTVLTRQIQQQRELNETADTAKDSRMNQMREELDHTKAQLDKTSQESHTHLEKLTVTLGELEALKRTLNLQNQQKEMEGSRALEEHKTSAAQLAQQLEAREGEIASLKTELTIAQAEMDSMHGSRAQRAAEAAGDPVLLGRIKTLQKELSETITDYETMTKASIEWEKEREQLESLADGLRDRINSLEHQMADDRIQAIGAKSPGAMSERGATGGGTGAAMLKTEFKKMMRETRVEHAKALRVSSVDVMFA